MPEIRSGFGPRATRAMALGVAQIPPHALFEFPWPTTCLVGPSAKASSVNLAHRPSGTPGCLPCRSVRRWRWESSASMNSHEADARDGACNMKVGPARGNGVRPGAIRLPSWQLTVGMAFGYLRPSFVLWMSDGPTLQWCKRRIEIPSIIIHKLH
jgi:hypothetical protein